MAEDQDAIARQWLRENPNDPAAPGLRAKMRAKGLDVPDPAASQGNQQAEPWYSLTGGPVAKGVMEFEGALPQGFLGIPEAIYQGAEKLGAPRVPEAIRAPLRQYRDWSESTWPGYLGETAGSLGAFLGGGSVLDALGLGARIPGAVTRIAQKYPSIPAAISSTVAQPSKADNLQDFLWEKAEDAGLGGLLGRWFGRPVRQIAHDVVADANKRADVIHAQGGRDITAANKADVAAHKKAVADDATAALQQRRNLIQAKGDVPRATTGEWWRRVVGPDATDPNLMRVSPETGAFVQKEVARRLNAITDQMHLDTADPAFNERLATIRDETSRELPESDRAGWHTPGRELSPTESAIRDQFGRPARTIARDPTAPTGDFQKTVMEPLAKGPLTGRALTEYISSIGDRAEELARSAQGRPEPERVSLQNRATALREVQDAVIGHAASDDPALKLARDRASRDYMLWSVGNDAARASNQGVATPKQLINTLTRRLGRGGRGEARYKQSLIDPDSPYHDLSTWLQERLAAHSERVPSARDIQARQPPRLPPTPRELPPRPQPQTPPPAPRRTTRSIPRAVEHGATAAMLSHHPGWLALHGSRALGNLIGRRGGSEGTLEQIVRETLANHPRLARATPRTAGAAASAGPRAIPQKTRKEIQRVPEALSNMFYRWPSQ